MHSSVVFLCLMPLIVGLAPSCIENAPAYLNREWVDDSVIPSWKLHRGSGNTNMLILMHNYRFTCSGRLRTWYLYWRANNMNELCTIYFGLYVLRSSPNGSNCGPTIVGSHYESYNVPSYTMVVKRRPEVLQNVSEILVQKGDYIAVQIHLGTQCSISTVAWLRGLGRPSNISLKVDRNYISPSTARCSDSDFRELNNGIGFVSALVDPITASTPVLLPTSVLQSPMDSHSSTCCTGEIVVTRVTSVATTPKHTTKSSVSTFPPRARSSQVEKTKVIKTSHPRLSFGASQTFAPTEPFPSTIYPSPLDMASSANGGEGIDREMILLWSTICSLVLCVLMTVSCIAGMAVVFCKRRKLRGQTAKASDNELSTTQNVASTAGTPFGETCEEEVPPFEYDYIQPPVIMEENAAYNPSTCFTTYL